MSDICTDSKNWTGIRVGNYQVQQVIGSGGMAAVYRAEDVQSGRAVALKVLRPTDEARTDRRIATLRREYHTLAELDHPRIIEVYDYGEVEGVPYYTMELLDGSDLTEAGGLGWREACGVVRDVASSLSILHSRSLVHRDVSTRNVRRTADGRAKLLDFGAMQPMGTIKNIVGTPPFMAPEAALMQALDGRVDLFALGALAYYLLTGRHAYGAVRISDLRDVWRSRPIPPARLVPDIPRALSELVMQLLVLDRAGRPASAAEVFGRLSAAGELPREEDVHVSRAYLTTPGLVGRETELVTLRRTVLCFIRRVGGSLLVRGAPGTGRSRILDTCAMEAKLLGAQVVRADATDATSTPWGVASRLTERLFELSPEVAERASRLQVDLLAHVVPTLADKRDLEAPAPSRSQLIRALREFTLQVAARGKYVLLIDDVDLIDEPSAALLVALANKAPRCPLLIVATLDSERLDDAVAPIRMLDKASENLDLKPLPIEQTARLVASLFGGVSSDRKAVQQVAAAAQGNPRATMTYAQYLVDRGLARYERGSWLLPAELSADELPRSLSEALLSRLEGVGSDAREIADVLSLAEEDTVGLADLPALTEHGDAARLFRALDALVAERVLVADNDRYVFSQRGLAAVIRSVLAEERRRELSGRIAARLTHPDPMRKVPHLLNARDNHAAIALVDGLDLEALLPELGLLERVLEASESINSSPRVLHRLRMAVLAKASLVDGSRRFKEIAALVLSQIASDSGLVKYEELSDLPDEERLKQALAFAQARYDASPEDERVCDVREAIGQLARLSGVFTSMACTWLDLELLNSLPSLRPLLPLFPSLANVEQIVEIGRLVLTGRVADCIARCNQVLGRIAEPDQGGLDDVQYSRTFLGLNYTLGLLKAREGSSAAERHARILEKDSEMRANAWLVRALMYLFQGNADEWRKCQRRADLMQLQQQAEGRYFASSGGSSLHGFIALGDQLAIKDVLGMLERFAQDHAGWRPVLLLAQAADQRLSCDLSGALSSLEGALEAAKFGTHSRWGAIVVAHVETLVEAGNVVGAEQAARKYLALVEQDNPSEHGQAAQRGAAVALMHAGKLEEAARLIDAAIATGESRGQEGLVLGALHEIRARVAVAAEDTDAFEAAAQRCAREYDKSHNPRLGARLAAFVEDGRRPIAEEHVRLVPPRTDTQEAELHSRMVECVDSADRSRCALTVLLQSIDSQEGCLYGVSEDGGVTLLAAMPSSWTSDAVQASLQDFLVVERSLLSSGSLGATLEIGTSGDEGDTQTDESTGANLGVDSVGFLADEDGRQLEPFAMVAPGAPQRIAAVLLRPVDGKNYVRPSGALLSQIALELVARDDVDGLALDL